MAIAKVKECSNIQKDLIRDAYAMLRPGGSLIYSTCTFTKIENEDIINDFLGEYKMASLDSMERIWPHIDRGEGHFCARISKPDSNNDEDFGLGDVDFEIANNKNSASPQTGSHLGSPRKTFLNHLVFYCRKMFF